MINALGSMNIYQVLLLTLVFFLVMTSNVELSNQQCVPSSCGDVRNISFPFGLKNDSQGCGVSRFKLACEDNRTVLNLINGQYYVQFINYDKYQIGLVDSRMQRDNCLFFPQHSLSRYDFNKLSLPYKMHIQNSLVIVNCSKSVSSPLYITTNPCIEGLYSTNTSSNWNFYALVNPNVSDVREFCTISGSTWASNDFGGGQAHNSSFNYKQIQNIMADGFVVDYFISSGKKTFFCYFDIYNYFRLHRYFFSKPLYYSDTGDQVCTSMYYLGGVLDDIAFWTTWDLTILLIVFYVVKFVIGMPLVVIFLIYKYRRRHIAMDKNIEEFLQAHNNFLPIRYSYSNIKKITRNFKHKLGEGGYGSVYKGTLRSSNEVAIKILKQSKAHGQDFISEVATIGRIHHVNIVQLIGFCFEGSKQALVFDFMSNGCLDKHILTREDNEFLDYKKIYEIALGVARGIAYLHRGCDRQILHFDIKPHNILLDKNFTPKISDFGLAKLYPIDHSIVSMTTARGTLGYMAPEFFYKILGGVSYKADVYSFGKLLMEMAGRRKNVNVNANAEHSSQIDFPQWVYDHIYKGESVEMDKVIEEEREVIKKMIIVALWCVQLNPNHRPPMNKVLEMLEGNIGNIQMPPKPLFYVPNEPIDDDKVEMELKTFSTSSSAPIISASFSFGDSSAD